jgi:hypothetical protein
MSASSKMSINKCSNENSTLFGYKKQDGITIEGNRSSSTLPLVTIQREVEEMGKALKCPICQSTLDQPCLLSCIHAFCHDCISAYYAKSARGSACCPICKSPIATKRSITPSHHLAELVKAFKHTVQAFGLAPIVYSPKATGILLTQMSSQGKEEEQPPSLTDCRDHLSVSMSMRDSLLAAAAPMTAEEQRKATFLIAAQEKVIQVDKRTLAQLKQDQIETKNNPSWTLTQESATADALRADEAVNQSLDWMEDEQGDVPVQAPIIHTAYDDDEPCSKRHKFFEEKENALPYLNKEPQDLSSEMGNTVRYDDDNDMNSPCSLEPVMRPNNNDNDYYSNEYKEMCELADQWYEAKTKDFIAKVGFSIFCCLRAHELCLLITEKFSFLVINQENHKYCHF